MKDLKTDQENTDLAELIKAKLTRGDITSIAETIGLSKVVVSNHLLGKVKRPSILILKEAVKLIKERERRERRLAETLNS
jgi:DNA-binding transcriptional ArsR family regulator